MTDSECVELKNIKYKSMLLSGNSDEVKETVENLSNLDNFLEDEKKTFSSEPWTKLDKTTKLQKMKLFVTSFCKDNANLHFCDNILNFKLRELDVLIDVFNLADHFSVLLRCLFALILRSGSGNHHLA